ncbi:MAG TPA: lactate racemase domain-containing protein [Bacillota bacterium]|nr:lactate racemase domain-containing protein [Bacillota bacterium]
MAYASLAPSIQWGRKELTRILTQIRYQPLYPAPMKMEEWQNVIAHAFNRYFTTNRPAKKVILLVEDASRPSNTAPIIEFLIHLLQASFAHSIFDVILAGGAHQGLEKENARKVPLNFPGRVFTHDCIQTEYVGDVDGIPLWLNRDVVEADLRIAIGTVNLHPLAGFSGGAKILAPGVAGLPTIFGLHNLPSGESGQVETAIRNFANHVLKEFPVEFSIQLLTNKSGEILQLCTGELGQAWQRAVNILIPWVILPSPGTFLTCVAETTPFDQNLLGVFKTLPTVLSVLAPGGTGYLISKSRLGLGRHLWRLDPMTIAKERQLFEQKIGNRQIRVLTDTKISSLDWQRVFPGQTQSIQTLNLADDEETISLSCAPLIHFKEATAKRPK